ncbi:hypothetical protein BG53_13695 [Paenibacillus darwinianus]|uniref:Uncharacterized protein n=1 Tax=Paenibacillus darwinianus TaxID=1380763 RepID=A0A9W5W894_9BACL|nr:hypothetical protein BG53_13695 [Paenibacillus darwinianus]EXX91107.1 hypothetical protein BG52_11375 [Paenibacillus darwinianus]EXX92026.1 hypothetical protein CH50_12340 [Paenibacillus darwinianus]
MTCPLFLFLLLPAGVSLQYADQLLGHKAVRNDIRMAGFAETVPLHVGRNIRIAVFPFVARTRR